MYCEPLCRHDMSCVDQDLAFLWIDLTEEFLFLLGNDSLTAQFVIRDLWWMAWRRELKYHSHFLSPMVSSGFWWGLASVEFQGRGCQPSRQSCPRCHPQGLMLHLNKPLSSPSSKAVWNSIWDLGGTWRCVGVCAFVCVCSLTETKAKWEVMFHAVSWTAEEDRE